MTMIMRLERTSEEVKTRARHVIICDNYPEKHRREGRQPKGIRKTKARVGRRVGDRVTGGGADTASSDEETEGEAYSVTAPMAKQAVCRQTPEVGAVCVNAHVRIYAGVWGNSHSYRNQQLRI